MRMRNGSVGTTRRCLGLLLCLGFAGAAAAQGAKIVDDNKPVKATFAGASAQGTFSVIGEGIGEMVRRQYPGSSLGYEAGSNAGALVRTMNGDAEISFLSTPMARRASQGVEPFQSKLPVYEKIGTIFPAVNMVAYIIAREEFLKKQGVQSLEDVKQKKAPMRIAVNQKGNVEVYHTARAILEASGITEDDVPKWGGEVFYVPSQSYTDMIKDGKLDVIITIGYFPDRRVKEMQEAAPVTFMPISEKVRKQVAEELDLQQATIPQKAYDFLKSDYETVSMTLWIVAGPTAKPVDVYKVTKAIHKNLDYYRSLHPLFRDYRTEQMVEHRPFRLHPGAEAYYREVGLLKDGAPAAAKATP